MRKILIGWGLAVGLVLLGTASVSADTMPTPADGPGFGQHVAMMSLGNASMMTGATFAECVAAMASQGICLCTCPCPMP